MNAITSGNSVNKRITLCDKGQTKQALHSWLSGQGYEFSKEIIYDGKWRSVAGQKGSIKACGNPDGSIHVKNFETNESHTFLEKNKNYTKRAVKLPPLSKDCSAEFKKLNRSSAHPYLTKKKINPKSLNIKQKYGKLIVPVYSTSGAMISWQEILPHKTKEGKDKFFKKDHPLSEGYHFPIGEPKDHIFVCEGLATGATIHTHTNSRVYCAFSKSNLDQVTKDTLAKYPSKQVVLCLDNDGQNTHKTTVKNDRLIILCPEGDGKYDFNDKQDDQFEINKLNTLEPAYKPPEPAKENKPLQYIPQKNPVKDLKARLSSLNYSVRLNKRKDRKEINKGDGWHEISDEEFSKLYFQVQHEVKTLGDGDLSKIKKEVFDDSIKAIAFDNQTDPFLDYLKTLNWDKKIRLEGVFFELFKVEKKHEKLARWAFKSILLACVWRTFQPGSKHDEFVILQGPQGIGKSTVFYYLFIDKTLFSNSISFSDSQPRIIEGILDKAIVEIAELAGFRQADIEKMKNTITTQKDTVRLPYRRNARDYLRKCVFVGTTNSIKPLPDDLTGNRRHVLISVKKKISVNKIKEYIKENRDQLWAEAVHLYNERKGARLPKELWSLSAEVAEDHRGGDQSLEQLMQAYIKKKTKDGVCKVNIPIMLKEFKDGIESTEINNRGEQYTKKEGGGWIPNIGPLYQHKASEFLSKIGFKNKNEWITKNQRQRLWVKEFKDKGQNQGKKKSEKMDKKMIVIG